MSDSRHRVIFTCFFKEIASDEVDDTLCDLKKGFIYVVITLQRYDNCIDVFAGDLNVIIRDGIYSVSYRYTSVVNCLNVI